MKAIDTINDFLIAQATRAAKWSIETLGISNYRIARVGLGICFLEEALLVINRFSQFLPRPTDIVECFLAPILIFFVTVCYMACLRAELNTLSTSRTMEMLLEYSPWVRVMWAVFTLGFLPVMVFHSIFVHKVAFLEGYLYGVGQMVFTYFVAVGPLPPSVSKVRKFINAFAAGFRTPERAKVRG